MSEEDSNKVNCSFYKICENRGDKCLECIMNSNIEVKKYDDEEIEISFFTPMHNDFSEGMHGLLKEIVLYFMFDTDYKVKCKRIDES